MIPVAVQIAGGVGTLVYILVGRTFLSEVALKDTHKQAPFEKRRFSDVVNAIAASVLALLLLPLTLIPSLFAVVSTQFVSNFKWYLLFFVLAGAAVSWNNVDNEVITTIDQLVTEFGPPFVRDFLFPIGNALRLILEFVIKVFNLLSSPFRILVTEGFTQAFTCTAADLQQMVVAFFEILTETTFRLADFVVGLGVEDFNFTPIGRKIGAFVDTFQPLVDCFCADLAPVLDPFFAGFGEDSHLWPAIDRLINTFISVPRLFFRTLWFFLEKAILDNGICPPEDFAPIGSPALSLQGAKDQAKCRAEREPRFDQIADNACLTVIHTLDWIDLFPEAAFDTLFEILGVNLPEGARWPPIAPLVAPWICLTIDVVRDVLNLVTHIDLLVEDHVNVQFIRLDTNFAHAYNFSRGIKDFFDASATPFIENTGCVFSEGTNITIHGANALTRTVWFAVGHFPKNVGEFWANEIEPLTRDINRDATDLSDCLNTLASEVSPALGDLFAEIALLVGDLVEFFTEFITQIFNGDVEEFLTAASTRDSLTEIFDDARAVVVSLGNLIRTAQLFEAEVGSCTVGSFRDFPLAPILTPPDPACCLAGNVDAFGRFALNIFEWAFMSTLELSSGVSFEDVVDGGVGDLRKRVIPRSDDLIASFGCWVGVPFVAETCTDAADKSGTLDFDNVGENFAVLGTTALNITGIPPFILQTQGLRITDCVLKAIARGADCDIGCVCQCVVVFYDIGIGMPVQVYTGIFQLIECARSSSDDFFEIFIEFGDLIDGVFGWDGPTDPINFNIRDILCEAIEVFFDIISLVILFFTDPELFFEIIFEEFAAILEELIGFLVGTAQDLVDTLDCVFNQVNNSLLEIVNGLFPWIEDIFIQLGKCLEGIFELDFEECEADKFVDVLEAVPFHSAALQEVLSNPFDNSLCPPFPASSDALVAAREAANFTVIRFNVFNVTMVNPMLPHSPCNPIWLQIEHAKNTTPDIPQMTLVNDLELCITSHFYSILVDRFVFLNIDSAWGTPAIFPPLAFYSPFVAYRTVRAIWTGIKGAYTAMCDPQWPNVNETAFFEAHNTTARKLIGRTYLVTQIWAHTLFNTSRTLQISNAVLNLAHQFLVNGTLSVNASINTSPRSQHSRYAHLPAPQSRSLRSRAPPHRTLVGAFVGTMREIFHRGSAKFAAVYKTSVVGSIDAAMGPYKELASALHSSEQAHQRYRSWTSMSRSANRKFVARVEQHQLEDRLTPFTPAIMPVAAAVNGTLGARIPEIGEPNFCNDDFCFECEYIENVVDEFLELLCAVIENFDADIIEPDENFCNLTSYEISGTRPTIRDVLGIFSTDGFAEGQLDAEIPFDKFPGTWVDAAQTALLSEDADVRAAVLRVRDFVINPDTDDPGSIVFYGKFLLTCDVVEHARCDRGVEGLGFWEGALVVLFLYGVALVFAFLFFSPCAVLLIAFLPLLPITWWVSAYAISPRCLVPSPLALVLPFPLNAFAMLPITPECVPNDLYCSLRVFEGNCTNIWGGLVLDRTCPTAAEGFTRAFHECSDPPFNFDNIFRNFFYLLERFAPEVNDFLRTTNVILFSWIRRIPTFDEVLTFPDDIEFTGDDAFAACNLNTILNLPTSALFVVLASMLGFALIAFTWATLVILYLALYDLLFAPLHFLLLFLLPVVPPKSMRVWYPDSESEANRPMSETNEGNKEFYS